MPKTDEPKLLQDHSVEALGCTPEWYFVTYLNVSHWGWPMWSGKSNFCHDLWIIEPHWPGYFELLKTCVSKNIKKSKKITCSHGCSPCACRGHLFEGCCRGRWGSRTSTRNPCRRVSSSGEPGWNKLAIFHRKGIELSPSQFSPCRTTLAGHWWRNW